MDAIIDDDDDLFIMLMLLLMASKQKKKRRYWVSPYLLGRRECGRYYVSVSRNLVLHNLFFLLYL